MQNSWKFWVVVVVIAIVLAAALFAGLIGFVLVAKAWPILYPILIGVGFAAVASPVAYSIAEKLFSRDGK